MNKTLFIIGMFTMVFASAGAFIALDTHLVNACPDKSGSTSSSSTTNNNIPSTANNVNAILTPVPATQLTSGQSA
jgi:hypothetical protein